MWWTIILASIFQLTVALDLNSVNFGIDYFKYRNVKRICLLSCNEYVYWTTKFSKSAFTNSMAVSEVFLDVFDSDFWQCQQCLEYDFHSIGVFLDGSCNGTEDAMYFASKNLDFSAQHKWLIIENDAAIPGYYNNSEINQAIIYDKDYNALIETLDNLNISVDADVILGLRDDSGYSLYDIFNFGKIQGGNITVNKVGVWNIDKGLNLEVDLNEYKYYRRWDFQNWTMRMILVSPKEFDLELLSGLKPIPGIAIITHTAGGVLLLVAEMHNFRFKLTITDRWIATFDKNGAKAVATSIYYRDQDISPVLRFLPSIYEKIDVVTMPLTSIETRYYYRIPTKGPGKFENQFLMPLSPVAWWGVIGVSILCAFLLLLSARFEKRQSSLQYALFSVLASICQQFYDDSGDGGSKRASTARKVTILVTGLSCVLIYNYYTSSVVSWLLNGPPPSINSLRELLESPLELIFEDIGYTRSWLQTPSYYYNKRNAPIEDELRQKKVFSKKKDAPLLEPLVQGIKMVQKGGYAYHTEVNSANRMISKTFDQYELCELGSLQSMEKTHLHPCVPKNSPYKEFLTWSVLRLLERGFVSCIQLRTGSPEVKCEGSSPRALALGGAAPAFILLAGGYLLAVFIMFIERYVYKLQHRQKAIHQLKNI